MTGLLEDDDVRVLGWRWADGARSYANGRHCVKENT
jgi:hypothetical protein